MDLLLRLVVALLVGLLALWVAAMFLPHNISVLIGLAVGLVVFARGQTLL